MYLQGSRLGVSACRGDDFACAQIGFMENMCPANARFKRKGLINFLEWEQEFGQVISDTYTERCEPYEEEQLIRRQVANYGRDREELEQQWT